MCGSRYSNRCQDAVFGAVWQPVTVGSNRISASLRAVMYLMEKAKGRPSLAGLFVHQVLVYSATVTPGIACG